MSINELYRELIIDHGRHPRNFGELVSATHVHAGNNPLCGDQLVVYLEIKQGIIENIQFKGLGCAISMASASIMTETLKGKNLADTEEIFRLFHQLVIGEKMDTDLGKLSAFAGVAEFPARVKCASLAWHTLKAAINQDSNPVSTE